MKPFKNDVLNQDTIKSYEGLMCNGNGYMSLRATFEFDRKEAPQDELYMRFPDNVTLEQPRNTYGKWGTYIPGVVGMHPLLKEEMVNLPYFLGWNLYIEEKKVDILASAIEFSQQLNLEDSSYQYILKFTHEHELFSIESFRVADMVNKHYHHQNISILTESKKPLCFESFIDGKVTTNGYNHFSKQDYFFQDTMSCVAICTDQDCFVDVVQQVIAETPHSESAIHKNRISQYYRFSGSQKFIKNTFIKTHRENVKCEICSYSYNSKVQVQKWASIWNQIDIFIEGDELLQDAVRLSLYHLHRSKKECDPFVSIDAKGVAGEGYFGHYFWDTEIYLFPFFLYSQPEAARELLLFRYHTLEQAKENAKTYGYKGAKYPWESSISGREQCSNWQYSDLEIHVSFDIVYAIWQYYRATDDHSSMKEFFVPIMVEVSRYIVDRVSLSSDGLYHIKGVMGPDEYLAFTDNNAFTNYVAKFTLEKTVEVVRKFDSECPEIEQFQDIAKKLWIPINREQKFIHQCDRFDQFDDINFDDYWIDRSQPFGCFISQEKNYRSKALKQADVVTLLVLFEENFNQEYMKHCIDYYEPITTHDSSLSYVAHSIIFSKLQQPEKAYEYLQKAVNIDFVHHGAGEGVHIANCGGIYQAVIYGLAGLKRPMHTGEIDFAPSLPKHITKIAYKIFYKGKLFAIEIKNNQVTIQEV